METHLFQLTYWEIAGKWHCNDTKNLVGKSAKWYAPMRVLNLSVEDYVKLLLSYNAKRFCYYKDSEYLAFSFDTEKDVKAFCSYVNKIARKRNFICQ